MERPRRISKSGFDLTMTVTDCEFLASATSSQRNWLCERALAEVADDLEHLHGLSYHFAPGSDRPEIRANWVSAPAVIKDGELTIDGQQVIHVWQDPYMRAMAAAVTQDHGDVLEIGFGLGIAATYIQSMGTRSHTIIECNRDVLTLCDAWRVERANQNLRVIEGRWQDVIGVLGQFDGILFDTYPASEEEFSQYVIEDATFVQHFLPFAAAHLRPGGRLVYYSNEIDSVSRRHQRLLFEHFTSVAFSVCRSVTPPPNSQHWWANSIVVATAFK